MKDKHGNEIRVGDTLSLPGNPRFTVTVKSITAGRMMLQDNHGSDPYPSSQQSLLNSDLVLEPNRPTGQE